MDARSLHDQARKLRENAELKRSEAEKAEGNFHLHLEADQEIQAHAEESRAAKLRDEAARLEQDAERQEQKAADLERQAAEINPQITDLEAQIQTLRDRQRYLLGE